MGEINEYIFLDVEWMCVFLVFQFVFFVKVTTADVVRSIFIILIILIGVGRRRWLVRNLECHFDDDAM